MIYRKAALCLCAVMLGGCSSVNVVRNPSPDDNGIRFYRPKPYLLVTPADPTGRMVKLEVLQLPDYCEEYSIHPRGKKPPGVQLKDGWNLVGVGGPAPPPSKEEPAPAPPPTDPMKLPEYVLAAGNIPIGLYESVFDVAGPAKFLKGWRYVGFSPWGGGPPSGTDAAGMENLRKGCPPCVSQGSVAQGPLFGIVFFNGAMTFRQIDEIANNMTCPQYVRPVNEPVAPQGRVIEEPVVPGRGGARESTPTPPTATPAAPATSPPGSAYLPTPGGVKNVMPTPSGAATVSSGAATVSSGAATVSSGAVTLSSPRMNVRSLDTGVSQTSRVISPAPAAPMLISPVPAVKPASPVVPSSASRPAGMTVDRRKLEALEAEVFKSLDKSPARAARPRTSSDSSASSTSSAYSPPSPTASSSTANGPASSPVPELSPAMPLQ
ncbi:MAG: hypothetical protein ACYC61_17700 [Isosphaeraceae bacterium]